MAHVCVLQFRYPGEETCLQKAIPARLCGFGASSSFSKMPYVEPDCCHRRSNDVFVCAKPNRLSRESGANLIDVNEAMRSIYSEVRKYLTENDAQFMDEILCSL
jgi:hypothetical protein